MRVVDNKKEKSPQVFQISPQRSPLAARRSHPYVDLESGFLLLHLATRNKANNAVKDNLESSPHGSRWGEKKKTNRARKLPAALGGSSGRRITCLSDCSVPAVRHSSDPNKVTRTNKDRLGPDPPQKQAPLP